MARLPDVTLAQLRYFVEAASTLSMTRAATKLRVAQSAVSSAIAQLERQVGVSLFIRQHARGLVLTPVGEEFLRDAQELLAHAGEVLDAARGRGEDVRGRVRLACFVTLAPFVLPDLLSDLAATHPHLEVDVLETEAASVSNALRSGAAEVALSYDLGLGPGIERELIGGAPPHVILPLEHRLLAEEEVRLSDLDDEPMVLLDLPHSRDYFRALLDAAGATPRTAYRSTSFEAVRGLVARGHGFSLLNQRPAVDVTYCGASVATRRIAGNPTPLPIVVARIGAGRQSARARAVAAAARAALARAGSEAATP